jgi:hypothetical protein
MLINPFVRDSRLSFLKHKTDIDSSRSWRLAQGKPVIFQNSYDHTGTKKSVVWKYFGFIEAKDGPATKTNRNDPDLVQAFLKKWWVEMICVHALSYPYNCKNSGFVCCFFSTINN